MRNRVIPESRPTPTRLDVEVVGGEDDLEKHLLVDVNELLVPIRDLGRLLS